MDYSQLIEQMSPDIYNRLKTAVEIGKWPDGKKLTGEQREHCLQAIIAYDLKHKPESERVGFIHTEKHTHCGSGGDEVPVALSWKDNAS